MKRVIFAAAVAALSLVAGAKTIDVPLDGDVAAAVAAAEEGDVVDLSLSSRLVVVRGFGQCL